MNAYSYISKFASTFKKAKLAKRRTGTKPLSFQLLEQRNLLASLNYTIGTSFHFLADPGEADIVTISVDHNVTFVTVGGGDSIELTGDAVGSRFFQLSQTVVPNDTLRIGRSDIASLFKFELGDLDDTLTVIDSSFDYFDEVIIEGGGGDDTIDASRASFSVNLFGGDGDDTLTGGPSKDVIAGGNGDDIIDGRSSQDTISFEDSDFGVTVTLNNDGTGTAEAGSDSDSITNIEGIVGRTN